MKKLIALLLVFSMVIVYCAAAQAQDLPGGAGSTEEETFTLSVVPFENENTRVNRWYSEELGRYCLFLPAKTDLTVLKIECGEEEISVGETTIKNGEVTDVFAGGGDFTVKCGENEYPLSVFVSENIPAMYITTESGSLDHIHENKENKESGTVTIAEDGKITENAKALKSIKGRGNSTWGFPKKPYNIKFDKKTDLFGMGKAKKWSLLANYLDDSLIRNQIAFDLASYLGLPYTPEYQTVDLYINNEYMGNYLVCESVEVNDERVNIADLDSQNEDANPEVDLEECERGGTGENGTVPSSLLSGSRKWINMEKSPENITGGYLLELDFANRYNQELCGFVSNRNQSVTIKSPEYASEEEVNYIADLYQEAEDALFAPDGKNSLGKHYSEYFDMDSLVKMYMLLEYSMCTDAGVSSCYFYKDADEDIFHAGPAWDFDYSMQNPKSGVNIMNTGVWYANCKYYLAGVFPIAESIETVYSRLCCHEDFMAEVAAKWGDFSEHIKENAAADALKQSEEIFASARMNAVRWNTFSSDTVAKSEEAYAAAAQVISDYPAARTAALDKAFGEDAALVRFVDDQFRNYYFRTTINKGGDKISLPAAEKLSSHPENYRFIGWNTKADGSGDAFEAGKTAELKKGVNVFYAVWEQFTPEPPEEPTTTEDPTVPEKPEQPVTYAIGDVDNDKKISASDARLALRAAVGLEKYPSDSPEFAAADIDRSGKIGADDARLILRAAVGLEDLSRFAKT